MSTKHQAKPSNTPAGRDVLVAGLAACSVCGFEARGAIRKVTVDRRQVLFCHPCGPDGDAGIEVRSSVWAPETSQAALAHLVRTAHVILHLHGSGQGDPHEAVPDELSFDPGPALPPIARGARRVLDAVVGGRSLMLSEVEAKLLHRSRAWGPDGDAERLRRLAMGTRHVPADPTPAEIEGWIEGGGTYAGWTAETLAAQVS